MFRCRFLPKKAGRKNAKRQFLGRYSWEELSNGGGAKPWQKDVRFSLFDEEGSVGYMYDFDHVTEEEGKGLLDAVYEVLGDVKAYHVFSGNGHHIYLPVLEGISEAEFVQAKDDYDASAKEIAEHAGIPLKCVDTGVFHEKIYGRVPGGMNAKNHTYVKLVGELDGAPLERIHEVLKLTTKKAQVTKVVPESDSLYRPRDYCEFIKYCLKHNDNLSYEVWNKAMCILSYVDDIHTAIEISKGHKDYDEGEVRSYFGTTRYFVACKTIDTKFGDVTGRVCQRCPHEGRGGCASMVSGALPTPSASLGFHVMDKEKNLVPEVVKVDDVVNHWINIHRDQAVFDGRVLFRWQGTHWKSEGDITGGEATFPRQILNELKNIPKYPVNKYTTSQQLIKAMGIVTDLEPVESDAFDPERYINFKNGVYDLEEGVLHDHDPKFMMLGMQNHVYDPEALCLRWKRWLHGILDKESVELLQIFFGLTLSNIPVDEYQQFLWLEGVSGTGKSTVMKVLVELLTNDRYEAMDVSSVHLKDGGVTFDFRGKSALIFDDYKPPPSKAYANAWESFVTKFTTAFKVGSRRMRKDTFFTIPKSTLIFSSNGAPPILNEETGALRRLRVIRFFKRPARADLKFRENFTKEMSGIINWSFEGLKRYRRLGYIPVGKEESVARQDLTDHMDDPYAKFVRHHVEYHEGQELTASKLYQVFIARMGLSKEEHPANMFGKHMANRLPAEFRLPLSEFKHRTSKGNMYKNITIKKIGG